MTKKEAIQIAEREMLIANKANKPARFLSYCLDFLKNGVRVSSHVEETCHKYNLEIDEVMRDLIDNYFDELIQGYGLPSPEEKEEVFPEWSEEYLNTLGMSKRDF